MRWAWRLAWGIAVLAAAPAGAATYCVGHPECPADGVEMPTLQAAAEAGYDEDEDHILLGPGEFVSVPISAWDRLIGAGRESTVLVGDGDAGEYWGTVLHPGRSVTDLTVRLDDDNRLGIDADGAALERVDIDGTSLTVRGVGIVGWGSSYRDGRVVMAQGVGLDSGVDGEDLVIEAPVGYAEGDLGGSLRRSLIRAETGVLTSGRGLQIEDTVIVVDGDEPAGMRSDRSSLEDARIRARNVTILGPGHGVGVETISECDYYRGAAELRNVAISGFSTDLRRVATECEWPAWETPFVVRSSVYDPAKVESTGPGAMDADPPVARELDLIDPAGGDFRPRWTSDLIDAGSGPATERDLRGLPRVGAPDVGAFEYQFAPPLARAKFLAPSSFDARASEDVDGDPLTFAWTFDDGAGAEGALVEHPPGGATVRVTDVTGRSASARLPVADPVPEPTASPTATPTPAPEVHVLSDVARRLAPLGLTIRARRLPGRGLRYRLTGTIQLPRGTSTSACAGGRLVLRVPVTPRRSRERSVAVDARCRFRLDLGVPRRYRRGFVRLYPLFRGAPALTALRGGAITLRPR
jgi:hypothetical protein